MNLSPLLRRYFMHPEFKALLETVGPKGEFIDTNAARTINPGHCIETAWFIMEEAKLRNWDKDLLDTALTIFDWSWDWGWDKQYGGIINFRDCRNLPPQGLFTRHEVLVATVRDNHCLALCLPWNWRRGVSLSSSAY